jgi:hypothetical protein
VQLHRPRSRATTRAVLWWVCRPSHYTTSPTKLGSCRLQLKIFLQYDRSSVRSGARQMMARLLRCMPPSEIALPAPHTDCFLRFIFGGAVNQGFDLASADDEGYMDVYILSLPAFRWFKANATASVRRASHTCIVVGKRQMISIGGRLPSNRRALGKEPDPWTSGIGIFDMSLLRWQDHYDAGAETYDTPDPVKGYYTTRYREPSQSNDTMASMFSKRRLALPNQVCLQTDFDCRTHRRICRVYRPRCIERAW